MLLISIHDVSPARPIEIEQLWEMCTSRGVLPALLVVPDWHGAWPLPYAPSFVSWLQKCVDAGAEIILHGYRHDEHGVQRTIGDHCRALGRTAREGEFLTLEQPAATTRMANGLRVLRTLGFSPVGFIPPAWLAREGCHRAARELGLTMSEDAHAVRLHKSRMRLRAPALCWSGRTSLRAWSSAALAEVRWAAYRDEPLMRLALHPADLDHPATARSIERALDRWLAVHPPVSYGALAAAYPSSAPARETTSR